ncbi:MAG: DUF3604 domain-containing protein [Bacteroidetes bacterium]|nr:DUF3604 domain-containing protein [Bacteroidota bacterium]
MGVISDRRVGKLSSVLSGRKMSFIVVLCFCLINLNQSWSQVNASLSPSSLTVNTPVEIDLTVTSTDTIPENTLVKVWVPAKFKDIIWLGLSNLNATTEGASSTEILSVEPAVDEQSPIWDHDVLPIIITIKVKNAPLLPSEKFKLKMGDLFNKLRTPAAAGAFEFKIALVDDSDQWTEVARSTFECRSLNAEYMNLYAPSVLKTGDTMMLKLVMFDLLHNRSEEIEGTILLSSTDPNAEFAQVVDFELSDHGHIEVPVIYSGEGFFRMTATVTSTNGQGRQSLLNSTVLSNYTWVQDDPQYYIYWGDLHSHSEMSRDGAGNNAFEYAEFSSCLDYFSASEHINGNAYDTLGLNDEEWEKIKTEVVTRHKPGKFVTITAYESSYASDQGGHHIAYFNHDDSDIDLVPRLTMSQYNTIFALWDRLAFLPPELNVLCWPHFTGAHYYNDNNGAGWDFSDLSINQGSVPRLVGEEYFSPFRTTYEVYSQHGQSEYIADDHPLNNQANFWGVQDALAMGEKVGISAFSDSHFAKPGLSRDGQGAILAPALNRGELFEAIVDRRTYGSTGERIIMDFTINDTTMGGDVEVHENDIPQIDYLVYGTDELERVQIVKWDFNFGTYGDDYHPDFQTIGDFALTNGEDHLVGSMADLNFYGDAVYYLRAIQKNPVNDKPVWSWSSPIWVDNLDLDTSVVSGVSNSTLLPISVYPNPITTPSDLKVDLMLKKPENATFRLCDIQGRVVMRSTINLASGSNAIRFELPQMAEGIYWLYATDSSDQPMGRSAVIIR